MGISNGSSFPLLLGVLSLLVCSVCVGMACEVDEVRMSNCCVSNRVGESPGPIGNFLDLKSLGEDIHTEYLSWLLGVSLLAHDALRPSFISLLLLLDLFDKLIGVLLGLHLSHYLFALLLSKTLLLICLLINLFLHVFLEGQVILIILIGE